MENFEEQASNLLNKYSSNSLLEECEKKLEESKKIWKQILEWQGACIRANLAIKSIKIKKKGEKWDSLAK